MKTVYQAADGKIFESDTECSNYEFLINVAQDKVFIQAVTETFGPLVTTIIDGGGGCECECDDDEHAQDYDECGCDGDDDIRGIPVDGKVDWDNLARALALNFAALTSAFHSSGQNPQVEKGTKKARKTRHAKLIDGEV